MLQKTNKPLWVNKPTKHNATFSSVAVEQLHSVAGIILQAGLWLNSIIYGLILVPWHSAHCIITVLLHPLPQAGGGWGRQRTRCSHPHLAIKLWHTGCTTHQDNLLFHWERLTSRLIQDNTTGYRLISHVTSPSATEEWSWKVRDHFKPRNE